MAKLNVAMLAQTSALLPDNIEEVHAFWIAGGSCDGCSIAAVGATSPSVEDLTNGTIPGAPKVILHHPVLAVNAGESFMEPFRLAAKGELGAPFVVLREGSIMDEGLAAETGGYWSGMGSDEDENKAGGHAGWLLRARRLLCRG